MKPVFLYNEETAYPNLVNKFRDFTLTTAPVAGCGILLRWGNVNGSDENMRLVLNRKQALKNCLDKANIFEILSINRVRRPRFVQPQADSVYPLIGKRFDSGITARGDDLVIDFPAAQRSKADFFVECINTVKKYNIYIFDQKVICVTKKMAVKTNSGAPQASPVWEYEEIPAELDRDSQKVCLLGQRTVHVLSLDFAMVHAGIDTYGRAMILDITPTPTMTESILTRFHRHVADLVTALADDQDLMTAGEAAPGQSPTVVQDKVKLVLLGADPEFMLRDRDTGQIVYPSDYLNKEGPLGYDERSERREGHLFPLAEIRPDPDCCPLILAEKIRQILIQAAATFPPQVEWLGGSLQFEQYQLGGHIHFSNLELNARLIRTLDNYLAVPLMLVEHPVKAARRRKQYGWLGSIRHKPHGGFEYRTPASWLVSPELARASLCLAKIVATEFRLLNRDCFVHPTPQKAFYLSKKHYFYDIFDDLWADLTRTTLYPLYASQLVPLRELITSRSHWNQDIDFRFSWGLL